MDDVKRIDTPYNNAVALFNRANELLNENGVKDSTGTEIAQLEQNPANPAWLFALACGALHTSWQEQLSKAYACLDPQSCEDDQVLVLASLAGIQRGDGTPSHISVRIENTSDSQITMPVGSVFKESVTNNTWSTNKELTLEKMGEMGSATILTLFCSVDGNVELGENTSFDSKDGFPVDCVSTSKSSGGNSIESISSLRNRIMQGVDTNDRRTQCQNAIAQLPGIESCSIWFNSGISDLVISDKVIPGRNAYVSVKGVDMTGELAKVYYRYMNVPATVGAQQELCMVGLQQMSVNFDYATEKLVDVFVYINKAGSELGAGTAIKSKLAEYSGTLNCGENLTAQMVSNWVKSIGFGTIVGCNVGTSDGIITNIKVDEYCVFNAESIHVLEYTE